MIIPALMNGAETLKRVREGKLDANATADVRSRKARQDKNVKNEGTTKVVEMSKKVQERRSKWYGHAT